MFCDFYRILMEFSIFLLDVLPNIYPWRDILMDFFFLNHDSRIWCFRTIYMPFIAIYGIFTYIHHTH